MSTPKRKAIDAGLQRRVRVRRELSEGVQSEDSDRSVNGDFSIAQPEESTDSESSKIDSKVCLLS